MIDLKHVVHMPIIAGSTDNHRLLKVDCSRIPGLFRYTQSGYILGIASEHFYNKTDENKVSVPVLIKFISNENGFKIKHFPRNQIHIHSDRLKLSIRRVRELNTSRFEYLKALLNYNDMVALLFDSQKSIRCLFEAINNLIDDYTYVMLEGRNTGEFYKNPQVKYVVLAEFFPLKNCIMLYKKKIDGFGLTLNIIDPYQTTITGRLQVKNYVNLLFSRHRENVCVVDGTQIRGSYKGKELRSTIDLLARRALLACIKTEGKNKNIHQQEKVCAISHDYQKKSKMYWSSSSGLTTVTSTTFNTDPWG